MSTNSFVIMKAGLLNTPTGIYNEGARLRASRTTAPRRVRGDRRGAVFPDTAGARESGDASVTRRL